jgi:heat shock protein HtpX
MNQLKTLVLLGALSALLVGIGGAIGGTATWFFLALALAMNLGAYFFSDAIVLRMSGARVIDEAQAPALFGMVRELAERAGVRSWPTRRRTRSPPAARRRAPSSR